ncbi:MAG: hypothetical protein Q7S08_04665, partial [bacterium]|nr:hypothetical protein [bacterium]
MSTVNRNRGFLFRLIIFVFFVCVFIAVASPVKAYAALPVYQCVGKDVYVETPGCTRKAFNDGSIAITKIRRTLPSYDKAAGDVNKQAELRADIANELTILELPFGTDPVAAARALVTQIVPSQEKKVAKPLLCEWTDFFVPTCWLRMISVLIGTLLISISALILAIADMLFNWSVDNTILLFSSAVFDRVKDGVNAGWTAMRD